MKKVIQITPMQNPYPNDGRILPQSAERQITLKAKVLAALMEASGFEEVNINTKSKEIILIKKEE